VVLVLISLIAAWFFTNTFSRKILLLMQAIFRSSGGEAVTGFWGNTLYYPKVIVEQFSYSPLIGLLMLVALFLPFVAFRFRKIGILYTFIWTVLILATLTVPTKAPQFIYIVAPFTFMIFAATLVYFWDLNRRVEMSIIALVLILSLFSLPRLVELYLPQNPQTKMTPVLEFFRQRVLPRHPVAASFNLQRLSPEGLVFYFWNWNAPVLTDPIMGEEELYRNGKYFLTVNLETNSPVAAENLDDSLDRWNMFLMDKLRTGKIREYSQRSFNGLGLTARIYEKTIR